MCYNKGTKEKEITQMKKIYYMHKSFGHLVTYQEMMKEMEEWYDGGDPTNVCSWNEYYKCLGPLDL